jgi:FKBP-type peptidyl-prolyl cis-trans isomerase (trigger factor)
MKDTKEKKEIKEKIYGGVVVKKLPKSEIEITADMPAVVFDAYRQAALRNINQSITIDGFRKGNVPEKVLLTKVGEKTVLEEMAELALSDAYPAIVLDHALDPVGRPEISITKMAAGNPLEFKIRTAVMPEVTLGDYKKNAQETPTQKEAKGPTSISEKEIDEALVQFKKSHAEHDHDKDEHTDEGHNHASFDTPEFRQKIKEALIENKRMDAIEKRRIAMADRIVETATIDLPRVLIESETNRIENQFKEDISRMGVNLDDYLKSAKKTLDDLRKEWAPHGEKKAKLQLALNKIAELEKIEVEEKEIEAEVAHILEHYKDADRARAHAYAAGVLTNEKVFQFLEKLTEERGK